MSVIDEFEKVGIDIPANKNSGQFKMACPKAGECGRKNLKDPCLSINMDEGLYSCHHCSDKFSGRVGIAKLDTEYTKKKEYTLPTKENMTSLSDNGLKWFTDRKLKQETVNFFKIVQKGRNVLFPYFKDGVLTNYKERSITDKMFFQAKNALPIMWNYDNCVDSWSIILTEGECDAMAIYQATGIESVTSVNQGAPNEHDKDISKKLACIDNCYELFENAKEIILAVDNDANGKRLENELVRRFGEDKCKVVDFGQYKDANEYLKFEGEDGLKNAIESAKFVQIAEVYTAVDAKEEILRQIREGRIKGDTTHFPDLDGAWTWRKKELNIWSGFANEGKTLFFNQLALLKAIHDGYKYAIFSPENFPVSEFFDDLIHMYVGKPTDNTLPNCMSEEEASDALDFLENHFFLVYPDENYSIEHIHSKFKAVIKRHGIDAVIIDPFNWLSNRQSGNQNRDQFVTQMLSDMKRFCNEQNVSYNIIAHQLKPEKKQDGNYAKPDPYKVKGASDFMDKADNVLLIQRPFVATDFRNPLVEFTSAKIKKPKLVGKRGLVISFEYDYKTMRYAQETDGYCALAGKEISNKERAIMAYERNDVFQTASTDSFEQGAISDADWQAPTGQTDAPF